MLELTPLFACDANLAVRGDTLSGAEGDDTLVGSAAGDLLFGGASNDRNYERNAA